MFTKTLSVREIWIHLALFLYFGSSTVYTFSFKGDMNCSNPDSYVWILDVYEIEF